jgi:hypothetical protein
VAARPLALCRLILTRIVGIGGDLAISIQHLVMQNGANAGGKSDRSRARVYEILWLEDPEPDEIG